MPAIHRVRHAGFVGAIIAAAALISGCAAQDAQSLAAARDQAVATLDQAQAMDTQLRSELTTRPADDPLRAQLAPQIQQLDQVIANFQAEIPALNAAISSAGVEPIDPTIQQAVSAIPYGSVALAVVAIIFAIIKHVQAGALTEQQQEEQKAFEQVVSAMDAAMPTPTPQQKAAIEGLLDADVKARVAAVRGI